MRSFRRLLGGRNDRAGNPVQSISPWPFAPLARSAAAIDKAQRALRSRNWDEAERHLADAAEDPPDRAAYLTLKALVSAGRQDWEEAERRWQAIIDAFPSNPDAYGNRATAIRMQGRADDAVEAYLVAMAQAPDDLAPPSMLAYMLEHLPRETVPRLAAILKPVLNRHLDNRRQQPLVQVSMAKVALAEGNLDEARRALQLAHDSAINDEAISKDLAAVEARLAAR